MKKNEENTSSVSKKTTTNNAKKAPAKKATTPKAPTETVTTEKVVSEKVVNTTKEKTNHNSGLGLLIGVLTTVLLTLLILIACTFIWNMYNNSDVVVTEIKEAPASKISSVTIIESTPTPPAPEPKVEVMVEDEIFIEHSVILNKDNRMPVEWKKLNFVVKDPRNKAVYYLAWKPGKGVGPVGVRVLDLDMLPTFPDPSLQVKFADPNMIEDLGFKSKTIRSIGNGVPVLVTE